MPALNRYPAANALASYADSPDQIYGTGSDGNVTISSNTTITSDMFYNNLTINDNITLTTNGYRVFVKNLLTLGNGSVIGFTTGSTAVGSIRGRRSG